MKKLIYRTLVALFVTLPSVSFAQIAIPITNAGTTGTTLASTAVINSSNNAVLATTSSTSVPTYIVAGGAGTTGQAQLGVVGQFSCTMDTTVASAAGWYYVIASVTTAGYCHPQAAAPASGVWIIGYLAANSTTSGASSLVNVNAQLYAAGGAATNAANTFTAANTFSAAGTASTPGLSVSGAPFLGTGTTSLPQLFYNCNGSTLSTSYSTSGTIFGINTCSGFSGNLFQFKNNGASSVATLTSLGQLTLSSFINATGQNSFGTGSASTIPLTVYSTNATPSADLQDWQANSIIVSSIGPSGGISAPTVTATGLTSGNCVQASTGGLLTTTGSACGGGGSLPTSTAGQTYYSNAGTGAATSAITIASASAGGAVTTNGLDYQISGGPASNTTLNGALTSGSTSVVLTSATSYPATGGYIYVSNGGSGEYEIMSYSSITTNTLNGLTRGMFGTSAGSLSNGDTVALITQLSALSTSSLPMSMSFSSGGSVFGVTTSMLSGVYLFGGQAYFGGGISSNTLQVKNTSQTIQGQTNVLIVQNGGGTNNFATDTVGEFGIGANTQAVTAGTTSITPNGGFQVLTGTAPTSGTLVTLVAGTACTTNNIACNVTVLNNSSAAITTGTSGNFNAAYVFAVGIPASCWYYQTNTKWYCHV